MTDDDDTTTSPATWCTRSSLDDRFDAGGACTSVVDGEAQAGLYLSARSRALGCPIPSDIEVTVDAWPVISGDALRPSYAELTRALGLLEWSQRVTPSAIDGTLCPVCWRGRDRGHTPGCWLGKLREQTREAT
jgi:hypothetical protein